MRKVRITPTGRAAVGAALLASLATIAACGGGSPVPEPASALGPAPAGRWSPPFQLAGVAVHASLLPNQHVIFWGTGHAGTVLLDPRDGTCSKGTPSEHELFCCGHSFLADGRLFIVGGHDHEGEVGLATAFAYDGNANAMTRLADMNGGRWYPTNVTLGDGSVLVAAGSITPGVTNEVPQVYDPAADAFRDLPGSARPWPWYPMLHLAASGLVFEVGPERTTRFVDVAGSGGLADGPERVFGDREAGASVDYDAGRIVVIGGGDPPRADAEVIDLGLAVPAWRAVAPMARPRRHHNAVLLADGTVLVVGGTSGAGLNDAAGAVLPTELWDPETEAWTELAPLTRPRLYHSTALLLADGRVLSAGGGYDAAHAGIPDGHDAEIFSPPYLFRGPRPVLLRAPPRAVWGEEVLLETPDAARIRRVHLIRHSSVTHSTNMEQRLRRLSFTVAPGGVAVALPSDRNLAPPGPYLLFVLDEAGVPSVGATLLLSD